MLFHVIAAVASVAFIAQGALAQQQTVQDIANNMDQVTQIAANTIAMLSGINELSGEDQVKLSAQELEQDLSNIAQSINTETSKIQVTTPFTDCAEIEPVTDALSHVAVALRQLLSIVIGKQTVFGQYLPLGPIATALKNLKAAIDSSAQPTVNVLPACEASIVIDGEDELDDTLGNAIRLYEQICIPVPSLLYPEVRPVCV